jgi:hypothetical protein
MKAISFVSSKSYGRKHSQIDREKKKKCLLFYFLQVLKPRIYILIPKFVNLFLLPLLSSSVLRARCNERGEEIPFDNGSAADRPRHEFYSNKQKFLDSRGVTHAVAVAISTHAAGIEGNAADAALELLKELLYSGNTSVQNSVYNYVCNDDKDAKFLGHFKTRMAVSQDIIKVNDDTAICVFNLFSISRPFFFSYIYIYDDDNTYIYIYI